MAHWLLKTEPGAYSFDELLREKTTTWNGISNAAALKHLRSANVGDDVFIYHTGDERQIVGTATVVKAAYPDPSENDDKLVVVDLRAGKPLKKPVTLAQIKADPRLAAWALVRIGRLSVVPTSPGQWNAVMELAGAC